MKKSHLLLFLVCTFIIVAFGVFLRQARGLDQSRSPKVSSARVQVIKAFYEKYFQISASNRPFPGTKELPLNFSQSLLELGARSEAVCREKAPNEICGWGGLNGDLFLDSQEFDEQLTFENTGITITDESVDTVLVVLNVYPSAGGEDYVRTIRYKMILEDGEWRVDDIQTPGSKLGLRKEIQKEIEDVTGYKALK